MVTKIGPENGLSEHKPWWGVAGLLLIVSGVVILLLDLPGLNVTWYLFVWYGYLLSLDAGTKLIFGQSLLSKRITEVREMLLWSLPLWFFYEAFNVRLENWHYVYVPRSIIWRGVFSVFAFATVIPACLFHFKVLNNFSTRIETRSRNFPITKKVLSALSLSGVVCAVLPILFPDLFFPLVWAIPVLLIEPWLFLRGDQCLLRDLSRGNLQRILGVSIAGLWAGLVWEGLNYWSRCKWIYTVPHFYQWKLFEMPLPGFLGFPVFALSAYSFLQVAKITSLGAAQNGRTLLLWAAIAGGCAASFGLSQRYSIWSVRPLADELPDVTPKEVEALKAVGLSSPEAVLGRRFFPTVKGILPQDRSAAIRKSAELTTHKGIGPEKANALWKLGIRSVQDLARQKPEELSSRLGSLSIWVVPREAYIWIRAAQTGYHR